MTYSIGEISALCAKAARGAGMSWGLAEEAGWAVRWLSRAGLPGADCLSLALTDNDGLCPVTLGVAVADTGQFSLIETAGLVSEPLLVLPFLSRLAPPERSLRVTVDGRTVHIWQNGTDLKGPSPRSGRIDGYEEAEIPGPTFAHHRIDGISPEALSRLTDFAGRTYAPATEASRLSGAGAGVTDND